MKEVYCIFIYGKTAFKKHIFPSNDSNEYRIWIDYNTFQIQESIQLILKQTNEEWYLTYSEYESRRQVWMSSMITIQTACGSAIRIIPTEYDSEWATAEIYKLEEGKIITIGDLESNLICYHNLKLVSNHHAEIYRKNKQFILKDMSINGLYINGMAAPPISLLEFGDCIEIFGLQIIFLEEYLSISYTMGHLILNPLIQKHPKLKPLPTRAYISTRKLITRAPGIAMHLQETKLILKKPPDNRSDKTGQGFLSIIQSLFLLLPAIVISLLYRNSVNTQTGTSTSHYMYTGIIMSLASVASAVALTFFRTAHAKSAKQKKRKRERKEYECYLQKTEQYLRELHEYNRMQLLEKFPALEEFAENLEDFHRLWNRNFRQDDFLLHRVGIGNTTSPVVIQDEEAEMLTSAPAYDSMAQKRRNIINQYQYLKDIPICVDLRKYQVIGIAGVGGESVLLNLLLQTAVFNYYKEVKMIVLYDEQKPETFISVMKWLPHLWNENHNIRYIAANKKECDEIFLELYQKLQGHFNVKAANEESGKQPHYLVIVGNNILFRHTFLSEIMEKEHVHGITCIFVENDITLLPHYCQNIIHVKNQSGSISHSMGDVLFDSLSSRAAIKAVRYLSSAAGLEVEEDEGMPEFISFLAMFNCKSIQELRITERWKNSKSWESLSVPVGKKAGGTLCYLDIHEKYHGPHGLIAGTTGAGKSELLQTYLLSLAVNFSPEDVNFFIIDYKGGGMGNQFFKLPHLIGSISNLTKHQVQRAMISIKSENRSRQRILQENGMNHISQYTKAFQMGRVMVSMPHLFIVVDEFAELKKEEPELIKELISVAQVGRSLGIHLILATQKPSGTVDHNIWSNSRFRLCLRVQDTQDSMDMLHKKDAAYLNISGRCYFQVGNDELYEQFQSAYSGAAYQEGETESLEVYMIGNTGRKQELSDESQKITETTNAAYQPIHEIKENQSQLEKVVEYILETEKKIKDNKALGKNRKSFWLPLLPEALSTEELEENDVWNVWNVWNKKQPENQELGIPVGLCDDPENQSQFALHIDFERHGHIAVFGNTGSGKSVFIQTLLYQFFHHHTAGELSAYLIDYSSHMMSAFEEMPHVGGVAGAGDGIKEERIFYLLEEQFAKRKKLLSGGNFTQYKKSHGNIIPAMVLVIDNYASFHAESAGKYESFIMQLAKEGSSCGFYLVISGAGVGMQDISFHLYEKIKTIVVLEVNDKLQYGELLRSHLRQLIPEQGIKGRGLIKEGGRILEFQTALVLGEEDDYVRMKRISKTAHRLRATQKNHAIRIPLLSESPALDELLEVWQGEDGYRNEGWIAVGFEEKSGRVYSINFKEYYCFAISGQKKSGKTNALTVIINMLLIKNVKIVILDLSGKFKQKGMEGEADIFYSWKEVGAWVENTVKSWNLKSKDKVMPDIAVAIENLEVMYRKSRSEEGHAVVKLLEAMIESGSDNHMTWFYTMDSDEEYSMKGFGLYEMLTEQRCGIHLGGNLAQQKTLDCSDISYMEQTKAWKAGAACVYDSEDEKLKKILIPLCDKKGRIKNIV